MYMRKLVLFVILLSPVLSWSMTEIEFERFKSNISNKCEDVKYQADLIGSMTVSILNWGSTLVNQGDISEQQYSSLLGKVDDINLRRNIINSIVDDIEDTLTYFTFTSSSSSNGIASCSWSTNDVFSCLSGLNSISTNVVAIYRILDDMYLNQYTLMGLVSTQEGLLRNIISSLSQIQSSLTSISSSLTSFFSDQWSGFMEYVESIADDVWVSRSVLEGSVDSSYTFINVYDLASASNNVVNLAYLQSLSNILNRTNLMGYDRFRYYAQGQQLDQNPSLYPLSPYDSLQHAQNASIFDLISAGFSSSLISLGSLNNYLYWLNKAVSSNRNETVEMYLASMSNMLGRVDSYVIEDFSNEFFRLSSYLQTNNSNSVVLSNLNSVVSLLDTNNLYLASISNDVYFIRGTLTNIFENVTNITEYAGKMRKSLFEGVNVLQGSDSEYSALNYEGSYFDFLTNRYITGTTSSNSSNWFERIETLLAALVFSGSSTTNLNDSLENAQELENELTQLGENSLLANEQTDVLAVADSVGKSYIDSSYALWHSLTLINKPSSISLGWGDSDTSDYNSLLNGNFRVSFTSDKVDAFTEVVHSLTTFIWVLLTMSFVWKGSFWIACRLYALYQVLHHLILSTWGNK